jgi:NitT/TauT family transport system permease protein
MRLRVPERLANWLLPAAGVAVLIGLWQLITAAGLVPSFLLPEPGKVVSAIARAAGDGTLARHLEPTLIATVTGYLIGCASAVLLAALVCEFKWVERALLLHLFALQSIPKVSIAPLVFLWAGFDIGGKIILVALICFFPVFANSLSGLRAVSPELHDLMRAAGASRLHIWIHLKLPGALRQMFAGLEVSVAFALIGCVVMEFVGATRGMGFLIQDASSTYDLALSFAAMVVLGAIGVLGNAAIRGIRAGIMFWDRGDRQPETGRA